MSAAKPQFSEANILLFEDLIIRSKNTCIMLYLVLLFDAIFHMLYTPAVSNVGGGRPREWVLWNFREKRELFRKVVKYTLYRGWHILLSTGNIS